jgi:hypothetical protein
MSCPTRNPISEDDMRWAITQFLKHVQNDDHLDVTYQRVADGLLIHVNFESKKTRISGSSTNALDPDGSLIQGNFVRVKLSADGKPLSESASTPKMLSNQAMVNIFATILACHSQYYDDICLSQIPLMIVGMGIMHLMSSMCKEAKTCIRYVRYTGIAASMYYAASQQHETQSMLLSVSPLFITGAATELQYKYTFPMIAQMPNLLPTLTAIATLFWNRQQDNMPSFQTFDNETMTSSLAQADYRSRLNRGITSDAIFDCSAAFFGDSEGDGQIHLRGSLILNAIWSVASEGLMLGLEKTPGKQTPEVQKTEETLSGVQKDHLGGNTQQSPTSDTHAGNNTAGTQNQTADSKQSTTGSAGENTQPRTKCDTGALEKAELERFNEDFLAEYGGKPPSGESNCSSPQQMEWVRDWKTNHIWTGKIASFLKSLAEKGGEDSAVPLQVDWRLQKAFNAHYADQDGGDMTSEQTQWISTWRLRIEKQDWTGVMSAFWRNKLNLLQEPGDDVRLEKAFNYYWKDVANVDVKLQEQWVEAWLRRASRQTYLSKLFIWAYPDTR